VSGSDYFLALLREVQRTTPRSPSSCAAVARESLRSRGKNVNAKMGREMVVGHGLAAVRLREASGRDRPDGGAHPRDAGHGPDRRPSVPVARRSSSSRTARGSPTCGCSSPSGGRSTTRPRR
jgi:hypothetical protein